MNLVIKMKDTRAVERELAAYQVVSNNPYIKFYAKLPGATVSVYSSGKVMFQGANAEVVASRFGLKAPERPQQQSRLIGTDEVGNGSYFGALVVVASYVADEDLPLLKKLGVDDSKKLDDKKICQIAPILIEEIAHVALTVQPRKYNEVIASGYNAVSIKVALHNQAIVLLEKKLDVQPEHIIIDAFTTEKNYAKYLKNEKNQTRGKITLLPKAESQYLAVATSSVIARYLFLENLKELSEEVALTLPSGAGAKSDKVAAEILKSGDNLGNYAKLHFANTEKAQKIAHQ